VSPGLATVHKFEEFLEFGLLTNWKNSSYIEQIRGIPRIRGGIPPILRARGNAQLNAQVPCTSRFALLIQYQDITSRPVEQ